VNESLPAGRARLIGCTTVEQARTILARQSVALVIVSSVVGNGGYRAILRLIQNADLRIPVVVLSRCDWRDYLEAKRLGAYECLPQPLNRAELSTVVNQALSDLARSDHNKSPSAT
jgi:DNA-binding NtrC family response regulator